MSVTNFKRQDQFSYFGGFKEIRSKWMLSNLSKDMHVERWNIYTSSH